jgi:hypothetical protein
LKLTVLGDRQYIRSVTSNIEIAGTGSVDYEDSLDDQFWRAEQEC